METELIVGVALFMGVLLGATLLLNWALQGVKDNGLVNTAIRWFPAVTFSAVGCFCGWQGGLHPVAALLLAAGVWTAFVVYARVRRAGRRALLRALLRRWRRILGRDDEIEGAEPELDLA